MALVGALLCVLVLGCSSLSAQESSAPNCTGVEDFGVCLGNTDGFCPTNIFCSCINEKPFCRCNNFRVGWKDYWYMGPKCNHLWNTLDFILVATVPALALVLIVVAIFSFVYSCKTSKAGRKQPTLPHGAQSNPGFTADTAAHLRYPQAPRAWDGHIPKPVVRRQDFDDISLASQGGNYSPVYSQPLRTPDPGFSLPRPQREGFDHPSRNLPYAEGRPHQNY